MRNEENPETSHRKLLIAPDLAGYGRKVGHIRKEKKIWSTILRESVMKTVCGALGCKWKWSRYTTFEELKETLGFDDEALKKFLAAPANEDISDFRWECFCGEDIIFDAVEFGSLPDGYYDDAQLAIFWECKFDTERRKLKALEVTRNGVKSAISRVENNS